MPDIAISFLASPGPWWWLGLLATLMVASWAYYRLAAPLGSGLRTLLRVARLLALLLLLAALLEPLLTRRGEAAGGDPHLAVLVDRSSSMRLPGAAAASRRDEAAAAVDHLEDQLAGSFTLDLLGFGETIQARREGESSYPWTPLGVTAIGEALEDVLMRQGEAPVGGIVLVTDGVHTAGKDPALVARNLPVPVFAVTVGDTAPPPDLLLRQVRAPAAGYTGEPLALQAVLETWGFEGRAATVFVRERAMPDGAPTSPSGLLAQRTLELPATGGREMEARLEVRPTHVGLTLYEVGVAVAAPTDGADEGGMTGPAAERVLINNTRLVAVDVREKKTRVLYIEQEPDWDFAFLKRTLDADTSLAYSYLLRQGDGGFSHFGTPGPPRLPRTAAELAPYAAIILGRAVPGQLPPQTQQALETFVLEGGGLLILGAAKEGDLASWAGRWGDLLPLVVRAEPRWGYTPSLIEVSVSGLSHGITAIDESPLEAERGWQALPPVWIREGGYRAAAGATVLLNGRTAHPAREVPLLALAQAGAGRIGVFAARGFWRWEFAMRAVSEEVPLAGDFWRRLMRWLAEPSQRERFMVSPARRVFQDSEPLSFAARLYDEAYKPIPGARIELTVEAAASLGGATEDGFRDTDANAKRGLETPIRIQLYPDGPAGHYAGTAAPLPPGMYRFQATAEGQEAGRRRSWTGAGLFWVEPMGPEFFDLAASDRLPRLLAEASGGMVVGPGELGDLARAVPQRFKRVSVVHQAELWNHWILFGFILIALSLEWFLRRRHGLV